MFDASNPDTSIIGIERLKIPQINLIDATGGVRIYNKTACENYEKTTSFPCPLLLSATWNTELSYEYAHAIGEECKAGGIHFLLGPGLNIYRSSLNGRNFEYMGEDPYLTGAIAASYVKGMQSTGVAATAKHFICNNEEHKRRSCNVVIDERTLHEIYMPGFKAAIDAGVFAVMTAYNQLNGEWCGQSKQVATELLRNDLGFKWLCMTDWNATWDGEKLAKSGTDLEKPFGYALKKDKEKLLGSSDIDRMALNILKTCIAAGFYEKNFQDTSLFALYEQHEKIAKMVNDEGIVLLKNNGILPINIAQPDLKILVSGNNSKRLELSGGGSAHIKGYNLCTYLETITDAFGTDAVTYSENPTHEQICSSDLVILFCGYSYDPNNKDYEGENRVHSFNLPDNELITRCALLNAATVVCIVAGGGVCMDWAENTAAIIHTIFGGQTGPESLIDIITGKVNPSGKLPFTIECKFEDSPAYGYDKIVPNRENPYYGMPEIKKDSFYCELDGDACYTYDLKYEEGIYVGYRWYERKQIKTRFSFGHGLSYTTFEYGHLEVRQENSKVYVSFSINNTGSCDGAEVAQIYVQDIKSSISRPVKELKGFKKTQIKSGESKQIEIELDKAAFSYWEQKTKSWTFEPREFSLHIGSSYSDIRLRNTIRILML